MKYLSTNLLIAFLLFSFLKSTAQQTYDEIVFYSNGSTFSPVVVLRDTAIILWTWDDNSTTNSPTPSKNYGTAQLRKNSLKVTPWSAVRRINVGYDAEDGGSPEIELVANQYVSKVENLELVAPYLREWCSSYNMITSLDFSNFVNLETIESFLSMSLESIVLTNTPKLKRACFVINALHDLDMRDCISLEEVLVGSNPVTNIQLPEKADSLWYVGARNDSLLINQNTFNNFSKYPNISHLSIWSSNQKGDLIIPKTNPKRWVWIRAYGNQYTSLDLRGALQNSHEIGYVDMHKNNLTKVNIAGCSEIRTLDLSENMLSEEMVDSILKQIDEFGSTIIERYVNLSQNAPPSDLGLKYKKNLEAKGWNVIVDIPSSTFEPGEADNFIIYPNPVQGVFKLHINQIPKEGVIVQITNINGQQLISKKIFDIDSEWRINKFQGNIFMITIKGPHIFETRRILKT